MKTHITALLALVLPAALAAQDQPPPPVVQTSAETATDNNALLTAEQLDQLLGPIALYPDALIAIILPASTVPGDIAIASRYVRNSGDPEAVSSRAWEESVKSLAHYPEVLNWMDENLDWTKQLGEAFREQPADVMNAVQRLRAKARAAGTLIDTPQQQVVVDQEVISVVPAQPDVIYVPYYDPAVVYSYSPAYYDYGYRPSSFVTFSAGFAAGSWLVYDFDWRRRTLWTADRHWATRYGHDWRRPSFPGSPGYVADPHRRPWSPPTYLSRVSPTYRPGYGYPRPAIVRPAPIAAAPSRPPGPPPGSRDNNRDSNRDDWSNRRNTPRYAGQRNDTPQAPQTRPAANAPAGPSIPANAIPRVGGRSFANNNENGRGDNRGTPTTGPASVVTSPAAPAMTMPGTPAPSNITANPGEPRRNDFNGRNQYADRSNHTTPPAPQATAPAARPTPSPAPVVNEQPAQRYNARYMGPQAAPTPAPAYTPPPVAAPRMHMPQEQPHQTRSAPPAPAPAPQPATQPAAQPQQATPPADNNRGRNNPDNERRRAQN